MQSQVPCNSHTRVFWGIWYGLKYLDFNIVHPSAILTICLRIPTQLRLLLRGRMGTTIEVKHYSEGDLPSTTPMNW